MDLVETTFLIMAKVFHQLWHSKYLGLSSCVVIQELMRFHQDGGPALIVMKGHEAWIMYDGAELKNKQHQTHIWDCSEVIIMSGGFKGVTEVTIFWESRFFQSSNMGLPQFCKTLKGITNPHQAHI